MKLNKKNHKRNKRILSIQMKAGLCECMKKYKKQNKNKTNNKMNEQNTDQRIHYMTFFNAKINAIKLKIKQAHFNITT